MHSGGRCCSNIRIFSRYRHLAQFWKGASCVAAAAFQRFLTRYVRQLSDRAYKVLLTQPLSNAEVAIMVILVTEATVDEQRHRGIGWKRHRSHGYRIFLQQ